MRAENRGLRACAPEDIKAAIISGADRTQVSGNHPAPGVSRAQDRGEAHAPVARGRARGQRALGGRRGILADLDSDAGPAPCGMAGSPWARRETTEFLKKSTAEPAAEEDAKGAQARAALAAPPFARARALRSRRRKNRRASWTGRRRRSPRRRKGSSEAGNPRRSPCGAPAPFPASSLSRIHEIDGGPETHWRTLRPRPVSNDGGGAAGRIATRGRADSRHAGDTPRPLESVAQASTISRRRRMRRIKKMTKVLKYGNVLTARVSDAGLPRGLRARRRGRAHPLRIPPLRGAPRSGRRRE